MSEKWYNSQLFSSLIGAVVALIVMLISNYFNEKGKNQDNKKQLLILITQSNPKLFSIIYNASINNENIDYVNLRKELFSCSIVWVLPKEIKELFIRLYEIQNYTPKEYEGNKCKIPIICKEISKELMKYGVDVVGIK